MKVAAVVVPMVVMEVLDQDQVVVEHQDIAVVI